MFEKVVKKGEVRIKVEKNVYYKYFQWYENDMCVLVNFLI